MLLHAVLKDRTIELSCSRRTRAVLRFAMLACILCFVYLLTVPKEIKGKTPESSIEFECNATELKSAQRLYFDKSLMSGLGYARFFSNKSWTDQVAIALFFREVQLLMCQDCPNRQHITFVDVGANIGQTVRFISQLFREQESKFPRGISFTSVSVEPSPETFSELVKEVKRARKVGHKFTALNNGVGAERGVLQFYSHGKGDQGATFNLEAKQGRPRHSKVKVITVDDIVANVNDGKVILKIDVEGYETNTMRGAAKSLGQNRIDAVIWEWVPEKMPKGSLKEQAEILSKYGYEVFISTLHAIIRIDGEYWDDAYETTRKTINCMAYRKNSPELLAIKRRNYLCGGLGKFTSGASHFNTCECWSGEKSKLPVNSFVELELDGFPMGRE